MSVSALSSSRTFSSLGASPFRLYLGSLGLHSIGFWMTRIAQDWLVLELTHSIALVGVAVALQFAPLLGLGLWGGVLVDRFSARRLLTGVQCGLAVLALTLGLLVVTGEVHAWHVLAVAAGSGLLAVLEQPARAALTAETAGLGQLRNATSLHSCVYQGAGLVGPVLVATTIGVAGLGACFLLTAVISLVAAGVLAELGRRHGTHPSHAVGPTTLRHPLEPVLEGVQVVRRDSEIRWAMTLVAVLGVLGMAMPVLLSAMAQRAFDTGASGYGMLSAANAVGAVIGGLLSARRRAPMRLRHLSGVLLTLGVVWLVASTAATPAVFAALVVVSGATSLTFLIGASSAIQLALPDAMRGRVMSVYTLVLMGGQALGNPMAGVVVDAVGPRAAMALLGASVVGATLWCSTAMARRCRLRLGWQRPLDEAEAPLRRLPRPGIVRAA